jgi:IS30 family transposase
MRYTHLSSEERYQIYALHKAGHSLREIGALLGRSPATVSRELRRNRGQRGYRPKQAHQLAHTRATACRSRPRITTRQWRGVAGLLRRGWSPQQIAERGRLEGTVAISHEWIYTFLYANKLAGGTLWSHLRGRKRYRKRYASGRDRRGQIPHRVGIEHRPIGAHRRLHLGHWEGDTLHGGRAGVVSLVDRKSRFTRLGKVLRRTAEHTRRAIHRRLEALAHRARSLTVDNGREFADHQGIAKDLDTHVYFARPYAAWQRGTNENTNGLIRQYLPKRRNLATLTGPEIRRIENRLNHRPRKCLGYRTPHEVFYNARHQLTVALRS